MAVKLYVTFHARNLLTLLIVDALQIPNSGEQISVEFADNARFSPDLQVLPFDWSPPPSLSYPPSFQRLFHPFLLPSIKKGDRLALDAFLNFQSYSFFE